MAGRLRRRLQNTNAALTDRPDFALVGVLRIPEFESSPWRAIYRRIVIALIVLFVAALVVYVDRDGYADNQGDDLSFLDAFYYTRRCRSRPRDTATSPRSPRPRAWSTSS